MVKVSEWCPSWFETSAMLSSLDMRNVAYVCLIVLRLLVINGLWNLTEMTSFQLSLDDLLKCWKHIVKNMDLGFMKGHKKLFDAMALTHTKGQIVW
jgi:hypothetical protein